MGVGVRQLFNYRCCEVLGLWPRLAFTKDFPVTFVPVTNLKNKVNLRER